MIKVRDASYAYDGSSAPALGHVSLDLERGERVCVLGATASGKSTLAKLMAGVCTATQGEVVIDDMIVSPATLTGIASMVGYVGEPCGTLPAPSTVYDAAAYAPLCAGRSAKEAKGRVLSALERLGIRSLKNRSLCELSCGEQQLVALASALAAHPSYLVLDNAFAQLDSATAKKIGGVIDELVADGLGVLETSHSLLRAMGANRVCLLDKGELAWQGPFEELLYSDEMLGVLGLSRSRTAELLRAFVSAGMRYTPGMALGDLVSYASANALAARLGNVLEPRYAASAGDVHHVLAADNVGVDYGGERALAKATLEVADELVVVTGPVGAGKSSLAGVFSGVLEPDEGRALLDGQRVRGGRVGSAPQVAAAQLAEKTVRACIEAGPRAQRLDAAKAEQAASNVAASLGATQLLDRHPQSLSAGEARRVALAAALALRPAALVLDEPAADLDARGLDQLKRMIERVRAQKRPVVIVTSDAEPWLELADRVVFVRDATLVYDCDSAAASTRAQTYVSCGLEPPLAVSLRSLAGMGAGGRTRRG